MAKYSTENIHTVALVGHGGAGNDGGVRRNYGPVGQKYQIAAVVVKLEQNYRSTQQILDVANRFYRGALYVDWRLVPKFEVQGAFQVGQDHFYDATAGNADDTFTSRGFFAEADLPVNERLALGGRYDWFDPSTDADDNLRSGVTIFANMPLNNGFQIISEYRRVMQQQATFDDKTNDNFQARLIWIW